MRILVTGSRDWEDYSTLTKAIVEAVIDYADAHAMDGPTDYVRVVHGGCPTGADEMADSFCKTVTGWNTEVHPAEWEKYGRAAGPRRNLEMVEAGADICLAFIKNKSRGATGCARMALDAGIPLQIYRA